MDVKSDTLPSLKHIAKTILMGCKGQKICYNSDIYHHNYNGEFMKKIFGFTLNACSVNIATCIRNRKAAFTLAEVLITLGIIGVVAAMTMPTLIMQHQKKVFATRVKQTYSIVSNALLSSVADNGAPSTWNFGSKVDAGSSSGALNSPDHIEKMAKTYIKPYLKVIKEGRGNQNSYYISLSNGVTLTFETDGYIDSNDIYYPTMMYIIGSLNGNTSHLAGSSRDFARKDFVMVVSINDDAARLTFFNWQGGNLGNQSKSLDRDLLKSNASYGCNSSLPKNKRINCAALIMADNWEIKDDYPWR